MRKPRIVQIVASTVSVEDLQVNILYGLADDGSVYRAEPNIYAAHNWEGPVVQSFNAEATRD